MATTPTSTRQPVDSAESAPLGPRPLDADEMADLSTWRGLALERFPYLAPLLLAMRPLCTDAVDTFAVDRHHRLYINFAGVRPRGAVFAAEGLVHESGHLLGEHADRGDAFLTTNDAAARDAFNAGSDCEINDDLVEAGCAALAEICLLPEHFGMPRHLTAEQYFVAPSRQEQQQQSGGHGSAGPGEPIHGAGEPRDGDGESGTGGGDLFDGCGSGSGGRPAPGELDDSDDAHGHAPAATKPEQQAVLVATAAAIRNHVKVYGHGSVPGGMVDRAEQVLTPPKVPWRTVLRGLVARGVRTAAGRTDVSYQRRSRRSPRLASGRLILPGPVGVLPRIVVVRDTSGSMTAGDLTIVTSEVTGIARQVGVRGDDLIVLDVDAGMQAARRFTGAKSIADVSGRGGTDMRVGIEQATALRPSVIVVLTDGETPWPQQRGPVPTVACIVAATDDAAQRYAQRVPSWIPAVYATVAGRTADG